MTPFEKALVAHLVGDWLLQNDWMATYKSKLTHPAAWVHAAIHGVLLSLALGWPGGLALGIAHLLIDTRLPHQWWMRTFGQTRSGEMSTHVMLWGDQVIHISTIALWLAVAARLGL